VIGVRTFSDSLYMRRLSFVLALLAAFSTRALSAGNITGTVRNQSRGSQPAAGDDVILVRLDDGTLEARAKTDGRGAFAFAVQYAGKAYLVRVLHQEVDYGQQASAGDALSLVVFDAAPQVAGVTGSIEILRTGTNGKLLHVSDMIEIKNESSPPLTRVGERTFEAYLPANAQIDSVLAAGPDKIAAVISAAAVPGEPGHYAVNFPLRPGSTKFAFNYDLPYEGHAAFSTRHAYPLEQLAIMIPPTMKFSSRSAAFHVLATGSNRYQVEAANQVAAGEGPAFEVFGVGELPLLGEPSKSLTGKQSPEITRPKVVNPSHASAASVSDFDSGLKQSEPRSQALILGGVTSAFIAACAFLIWRGRRPGRITGARHS
jgi:hypothetical protein